jgi:hypothetical protein
MQELFTLKCLLQGLDDDEEVEADSDALESQFENAAKLKLSSGLRSARGSDGSGLIPAVYHDSGRVRAMAKLHL